uniref:Uncharacterized protein n=1 Tax=Arundo donax TaxID=35708 RepID=A0A0A9HSY8_ARUDO
MQFSSSKSCSSTTSSASLGIWSM